MMISIRSATLDELPTLKAFEQGIVLAERPMDPTLKPDPISYYDLEALIRSEDSEVTVAELDGKLIASGYAQKRRSKPYVSPDYQAYIGFLYVAPEYRGKGINRLILDHLFEWARTNGLPEVHLTVYPSNDAALQAYEKAGFVPYLTEMRLNLEE
ncbi:MAG: GNAT family N-acetyltransferase [Pseudomonadota bacterium]